MTEARLQKIERVLSKRQCDLTVVLENVFDPHNVSAIMRSCDAVGVGEIYVLNTRIPMHKDWGFKSSRSASKWVTVHQFDDADKCMRTVKEKYERVLTTHLSTSAVSLYEQNFEGAAAIVFGNEQDGISPEVFAWSDGNIVIPQMGMLESLNISVACAIVLYEALRQRLQSGWYDQPKLSAEHYNELHEKWTTKYD